MLIDRTHRQWAVISTAIFVVATVSYLSYASSTPKGPTGGSFMGLLYGIVGAAFMIFAGLLAGRKQVPHWRLGSAQFWLRGHLWLGTLSLPFILYHSGFGLGGRLEQVLWFFFLMVIGSGFFGLIMQHLLPKLLLVQIPRETFLSQLPYVKQRTRVLCDKLISQDCGKIPLPNDVMSPQITLLGQHAMEVKQAPASKAKEIKGRWQERLQAPFKLLFVELSKYAKAEKWIAREDDFTQQMLEIYKIPGVNDDDESADEASVSTGMIAAVRASLTGTAATPSEGASTASRKMSALEQMKLKKAARDAEQSSHGATAALNEPAPADEASLDLPSDLDIEPPPKPLSPLEQMKQKAAAKKAAEAGTARSTDAPLGEKKLSPLELMKQQAAAKKAAAEGAAPPLPTAEASSVSTPSTEKKLSPLELMKQQAAAKKAALAAATPAEGVAPLKQVESAPSTPAAEPEKKLSPLELMKQQAAAKKAAAEGGAQAATVTTPTVAPAAESAEPVKKLSPLELMKQQAAAKKAAADGGQSESSPATEGSAPAKPLSPLEQMKAKAAAKAVAEEPAAPANATTVAKSLSPLEMMKAKAAAGGTATPKPTPPAASAPVIVQKQVVNTPVLRTDELRQFYMSLVRPFLVGDGRLGRLANPNDAKREFARMRDILPIELHDSLAALEVRCDEHRQYSQLERIHHWLHYWLILHIPFSMALLVLFVVHVVVALRVVPW